MNARLLVPVVAIVGVFVAGAAVSVPSARAVTAPTCYDQIADQVLTATKWLDSAGTLVGTPGRDVLVGSPESDTIKGLSGNDVICTEPNTVPFPQNDLVEAGSGHDSILGFGRLYGGSGNDVINFPGTEGIADGGSGDDVITGFALGLGGGVTKLLGGSGNDVINNNGGISLIDCGTGRDLVVNAVDTAEVVRGCERTGAPAPP
jgi:Ca2+-binding RTX toxin-like protein